MNQTQQSTDRQNLKKLVHGYNFSIGINVGIKLGLFERLSQNAKTYEDLARELSCPQETMLRYLGLLRFIDLVTEHESLYKLTEQGLYFTKNHPQSLVNEALLFAGDETYLAWSKLQSAILTGGPAFDSFFGESLFSYLSTNEDSSRRFQRGWQEITEKIAEESTSYFRSKGCMRFVDVGGGNGTLVLHILSNIPQSKGLVFDIEGSLRDTNKTIAKFGMEKSCQTVIGDVFEGVPPGFDAYLIKSVLHLFDDTNALKIFQKLSEAVANRGKIFVLERVLLEGADTNWANVVDCAMLVMTGGRERTIDVYKMLGQQAGLSLLSATLLPCGFSILEYEAKS